MLWKEFQDKMLESFGRNFFCVDDLHFNVKKEIRVGECVEFDDCPNSFASTIKGPSFFL